MRPRLLDLFAGAGGAAMGYHRAGFDVVGVDLAPQPHFPFEFHQADALRWLWGLNAGAAVETARGIVDLQARHFDAVHASPPCQAYTTMGQKHAQTQAAHPALIAETRRLLQATRLPYVIENVAGARRELDHPIQLCGRALGLGVARHRLFECSFFCMAVACQCRGDELPVYGKLDGRRVWTRADGSELRAARTLEQANQAMGIDWMPWSALTQAIPPSMTEHIGRFLLAAVNAKMAA